MEAVWQRRRVLLDAGRSVMASYADVWFLHGERVSRVLPRHCLLRRLVLDVSDARSAEMRTHTLRTRRLC